MSNCAHEAFAAKVEVQRLGDESGSVRNFLAEVSVRCTQCETPFHFIGPDAGLSFARPTVNVGATVLHAPISPGEGPMPDHVRYELST